MEKGLNQDAFLSLRSKSGYEYYIVEIPQTKTIVVLLRNGIKTVNGSWFEISAPPEGTSLKSWIEQNEKFFERYVLPPGWKSFLSRTGNKDSAAEITLGNP